MLCVTRRSRHSKGSSLLAFERERERTWFEFLHRNNHRKEKKKERKEKCVKPHAAVLCLTIEWVRDPPPLSPIMFLTQRSLMFRTLYNNLPSWASFFFFFFFDLPFPFCIFLFLFLYILMCILEHYATFQHCFFFFFKLRYLRASGCPVLRRLFSQIMGSTSFA